MATLNRKAPKRKTHEGGPAYVPTDRSEALRRAIFSCLLWEDNFYQDGVSIADEIHRATAALSRNDSEAIAIEAREVHGLRHSPLLVLATNLSLNRGVSSEAITRICTRPDMLLDLVTIYWGGAKRTKPIPAALKRSLGRALSSFSPFAIAKNWKNSHGFTFRDLVRLTHPKPKTDEEAALLKMIAANALPVPDTWETALSAGADKRETFERLIREKKLGGLALLRNLSGMIRVGVSRSLISDAINIETIRPGSIFPYQIVSAAIAVLRDHPGDTIVSASLDRLFLEFAEASGFNEEVLSGRTLLLVDVSGSMSATLSGKSVVRRQDAAGALAAVVEQAAEQAHIYAFDTKARACRNRGLALTREISGFVGGGTDINDSLHKALAYLDDAVPDRIIIITDEQSATRVAIPASVAPKRRYLMDVAGYANGVDASGDWTRISGFSSGVLRYIRAREASLPAFPTSSILG